MNLRRRSRKGKRRSRLRGTASRNRDQPRRLASVVHVLHAIALALEGAAIRMHMRDPAAVLTIVFGHRHIIANAGRRVRARRDAPRTVTNIGTDQAAMPGPDRTGTIRAIPPATAGAHRRRDGRIKWTLKFDAVSSRGQVKKVSAAIGVKHLRIVIKEDRRDVATRAGQAREIV